MELSLEMDGVPFRLLQETDLRWLRGYGTVFRVMDMLPSGNLCFGVQGPYGRLFIKYAGARTVRYGGGCVRKGAGRWRCVRDVTPPLSARADYSHATPVHRPVAGPRPLGRLTVYVKPR